MILSVRGKTPKIGEGSFVADSADLVGDVTLGQQCSIWFRAVIRGDVMPITIGDQTNIQDGTIIHGTHKKAQATIGARVTVGHGVILHGCQIQDLCLIGMGAVIMDNARVPFRSVVAAGALITEGATFESGQLILGRPAKAVRPLMPEELAFLDQSADNYLKYMEWYKHEGAVHV